MLYRLLVIFLMLTLSSFAVFAVDCSAVFPGYQPIFGNNSTTIETVTCTDGNGGSNCFGGSFSQVSPVVPEGGSNLKMFKSDTVTTGEHNYYNKWQYSNNNITVSGSGTAVLYFKGSNDIVIKKNARINTGGDAAKLLIIVDIGDKLFKLEEDSIVNAFIYVRGKAVFEVRTTFTGGISVENELQIKESTGGSYGYTFQTISDVAAGGFCETTSALHHIEITHDKSALICAPETLTIKACADENCTSVASTDVSVTLSATGATSVWSQNPVTIAGSSTAGIDVTLTHRTAESVTLSTAPVPAASNPLVCKDGSGNSCELPFADSGYLLTLANHQSCTTPNLTIKAVKLSDTGVSCAPAYTGNQSVDFVFNYANPISGTKVPSLAGTDMAAATITDNRTVNFDGTGTANLSFNYQDAGQIQIDVIDAAAAGLASSSVNTVVSPAKLIVASNDANADCVSSDASCTVFKKAGAQFNLSVSAACSDNTVTPNFEMNNIPLSINTIAPISGNSVSLGVTSINVVDADNGIHTETSQTVSEVGVFTITATPPVNSYFGETVPASTSASLGRFIPDHFELTTTFDGFLNGGNPFVYTGQMNTAIPANGAISYAIEPEFTISAKSALCPASVCSTTKNYTGSFLKMQAADIIRVAPTNDATQLGVDAINKVDLTSNLNAVTLTDSNGVITYQFNSSDNFIYTRNANGIVAPFTADINLQITTITDDDGISANDTDANGTNGILTLQPFGEEIRFGRWYIKNSFGPETSAINMPMATQYWNGNLFVTNTSDSFTTFDASSDASITDISLAPATTTASGSGLFANGETNAIMLSSPGVGNQGAVTFGFTVPSWLQYDWTNTDNNFDGPYNNNPSATATFGLYRGNDRIIYWREVFK